jgi:digeranylgeranylglycerophospholipid reductase
MPLQYDAVVIGAGPAGSMAAYEMAASGHKTLLLEKHKRPGNPLCCAEGVSRPSFEKIMPARPEWVKASISKIRVVAPSGDMADFFHPGAGYILDRKVFDYDLAKRAEQTGATLQCERIGLKLNRKDNRFHSIDILEAGDKIETVEARAFIAADGVESKIARLAGINNIIDYETIESLRQYRVEDIEIDSEMIEFHVGQKIAPRGYVWIFPKSENSANVGLGVSCALEKGDQTGKYLDNFLRDRFGRYKVVEIFCGLVPRYLGPEMFRKDNLLVVGDAARALDSLSGAGIINALLSGQSAGRAACEYLSGKISDLEDMDELYPGRFLEVKGSELKMYARLREVYDQLKDDEFNDIVITLGDRYRDKEVNGINAIKILTGLITSRPKLIRLVKCLL